MPEAARLRSFRVEARPVDRLEAQQVEDLSPLPVLVTLLGVEGPDQRELEESQVTGAVLPLLATEQREEWDVEDVEVSDLWDVEIED